MCARPSFISLAHSQGAEGLKGSAPRRRHMAIYSRCAYIADVGFRALRNVRACRLLWRKVPTYLHGKCLRRRTIDGGRPLSASVGRGRGGGDGGLQRDT